MTFSHLIENHEIQPTAQNHLRSFAACLLLSLSYLYFIASAIELPFINGDELIFFQYDDHSICANNGFYGAAMILGRTLLALLYCQLGKFIYQLDDFSIMRATAFIITATSMAGMMIALRNLRLGNVVAFALSAAIFTLPGILYYILCAASAAPSPSPLVALAGYAVVSNIKPDDMRTRLFRVSTLAWFSLAVILLIASANFVQAGLCFFLVPTAAMLLFKSAKEWPDTRLRFLRDCVTFVTGTGLYYLVHRLIIVPLRLRLDPGHQEPVGSYQVIMPDIWSDKIDVFNMVNDKSLHLWDLTYTHEVSKPAFYFLCLGVLSAMIRFAFKLVATCNHSEQRRLYIYAIQFPPAIVALLILVNLVSVISKFTIPRVMYPYQAVLVLAVFWAFASISQWLPGKLRHPVVLGGALLLMMVGGVLGQRTILYTAGNDQLAWSMVRSKILPHMDYLKAAHFIKYPTSEIGRTYTNTPITREPMEDVMRSLSPLAINEMIKASLLDHRDILRSGVDAHKVVFLNDAKIRKNEWKKFIKNNDFIGKLESASAFYKTDNDLPVATFISLNDILAWPLADKMVFLAVAKEQKEEWERYIKDTDFMGTIVTASRSGEPVFTWPGAIIINLNDFLALPLADGESIYSHILTGGNPL